jgi:hypothetical protein
MGDEGPKSAFEIAMARLRLKDHQSGVEQRPRTEQQKAAIAEVRSIYEAKLAQEEVMHRSALAQQFDPAARAALEEQYRRERERLTAERDAKIERIRGEEASPTR